MNKRIIKFKEFKTLVLKICNDIQRQHWRPDYIVGITRGGLLPAVMISHYLKVPMNTLNISLRDNKFEPESNLWMAEDAFGYVSVGDREFTEGDTSDISLRKNILIVDDINDSGETINWILNDWPSGCLPNDPAWKNIWNNNVKFAVVFDNLASKSKIAVDFCGEEINKAENDVWIEFPFEEWWTK